MAAIDDIARSEQPEPGSAPEVARSESLLERAANKRKKRAKHLFLDVPSWDSDMVAEYRVLEQKELDGIAERQARRLRGGDNDSQQADLELIAMACVGLHMIDPESGDRLPIEDDFGHVGYNRIATKLDMEEELDSNAQVIRYLTGERSEDDSGWKTNPTAITMHANAIARWMRDPSKRGSSALEALLGE